MSYGIYGFHNSLIQVFKYEFTEKNLNQHMQQIQKRFYPDTRDTLIRTFKIPVCPNFNKEPILRIVPSLTRQENNYDPERWALTTPPDKVYATDDQLPDSDIFWCSLEGDTTYLNFNLAIRLPNQYSGSIDLNGLFFDFTVIGELEYEQWISLE